MLLVWFSSAVCASVVIQAMVPPPMQPMCADDVVGKGVYGGVCVMQSAGGCCVDALLEVDLASGVAARVPPLRQLLWRLRKAMKAALAQARVEVRQEKSNEAESDNGVREVFGQREWCRNADVEITRATAGRRWDGKGACGTAE